MDELKNTDLDHRLFLLLLCGRPIRRCAPCKDIPIKKGAPFQTERRFLEGLILQELPDQFGTGVFSFLPFLFTLDRRQEQPRLDVDERRSQDQILPGKVQIERPHDIEIFQILLGDQGNGYIVDVNLIFPDEIEQKIQRTLEDIEFDLIAHGLFSALPALL